MAPVYDSGSREQYDRLTDNLARVAATPRSVPEQASPFLLDRRFPRTQGESKDAITAPRITAHCKGAVTHRFCPNDAVAAAVPLASTRSRYP